MKKHSNVIEMGLGICCLIGLATVHCGAESQRFLEAGEIIPKGWMKEQIRLDLKQGYLPHYEKVNHTVTHDVFVRKDRVSQQSYNGLRCWWSAEHEGYWKDSIVRMAFLAGDETLQKETIRWLDEIVAAQDADGYIGIYKAGTEPNHRFCHHGENGELWAQSRIFQALIAGWEFTGNQGWFDALKRGVDCTIRNDPGNYFSPKGKASGGVSHAVGFFDALWYLHAKTSERKYADYALKLYQDFNAATVRDDDLQTQKLLGGEMFQDHGAHIAEGFYVPAYIAALTEDKRYDQAARRAMDKLKYHLTPGGAMVCSEDVNGRAGSGITGYEYCGIAELVQALTKIVAINGDPEAAEIAESMTLNAGQGARFPTLTALSYISFDNRIEALSAKNGQRYAYAPFHRAAACCTLNGGRLLPYYIEGMWTRAEGALTAQLYGPCEVRTVVDGVAVTIAEETSYPFEDSIRFTVDPAKPIPMKLRFRVPASAADVKCTGVENTKREEGYVVIDRIWKPGDSFVISFDFPVRKLQEVAPSKETYLKRGPLVYALPIPYHKKVSQPVGKPSKKLRDKVVQNAISPGSGFPLYEIQATDRSGWDRTMPADATFELVREGGNPLRPFADTPIKLKGTLADASGQLFDASLVPLGCTVLRRTTFPQTARPVASRRDETMRTQEK